MQHRPESNSSAQSAAENILGGGDNTAARSADDNFPGSLPNPATAVSAMAASSISRSTSSSAAIMAKRMDRKTLETDSVASSSQRAEEQEPGRGGTSKKLSMLSKLESFDSITSSSSSGSDFVADVSEGSNAGLGLAGASSPRLGGGSGIVGMKVKDLVKMTDPIEFHEALTLPFTGDASVDAYYSRIEEVMSRDLSSVSILFVLFCQFCFGRWPFLCPLAAVRQHNAISVCILAAECLSFCCWRNVFAHSFPH